jgi:putative ABC transport system ATP-binding protein
MAQAVDALVERGEQLRKDGIVIRTYDLWKTYIMGDQEIHAVSGVDIEIKREMGLTGGCRGRASPR